MGLPLVAPSVALGPFAFCSAAILVLLGCVVVVCAVVDAPYVVDVVRGEVGYWGVAFGS